MLKAPGLPSENPFSTFTVKSSRILAKTSSEVLLARSFLYKPLSFTTAISRSELKTCC